MPETKDQHNRRSYDSEVAVLKERVNNWMDTTTEYRKSLCAKIELVISQTSSTHKDLMHEINKLHETFSKEIEVLREIVAKLPCEVRKTWYTTMEARVGFCMGAIALTWTIVGFAYAHLMRMVAK